MINPRLQIILLILCRDVITTDVNDTTASGEYREERVNGRIVKLYSGNKPDPVLCYKEGFQPDQNDCTIFYRCLKASNEKYTVFRFQCAPGTIYDVDKEICNYPQNTKRSECGASASLTNQRHENDIEDFQHELPKPIIQRDPENDMYLYKPSSQIHNNELFGGYQDSTTIQDRYLTKPSSTSVSQSNEIITDKPQFPIKTNNDHNNEDENRCTADGFMGDKRNCKKFYRCVNNLRGGFIRYEFLCNDATIWDDSIQGCNHAWVARNSRCGRDNPRDTVNDVSHLDSYNQNYFESNKLPVKEDNHNELNGYNRPNFIQTPLPIDKQTEVNTQSSTFYNEEANQIHSSKMPTVSYIETSYGEKIQDGGYTIINQLTTKSVDNESDLDNSFTENYRKNNCVENGFFGYADDCKKFYRCVESSKGNYIKYEFSCSDGTVWDNNLKACNFAWAVKDCGSSASFVDKVVSTTGVYPSTIYTSSFLTTHNDENVGYGIQDQNKEEMLVSTATPQKSNNIECKANGFYPDESNCQYFYRCVETRRGVFTKFTYQCGEGTLWDPNIEACNHAWTVKNCTVKTFNKTTTTTPAVQPIVTTISLLHTTTQANEVEQDYDNGYNQGANQFIVSTPKDTNKVINDPLPAKYNKCTKSGFIGDDNDCNKFYRCVDSGNGKFIQYEFSCGEGTVWDKRIESCNHAWAVEKCGKNETNNYNNEIVLPLKPTPTTDKINYGSEVYFDSSETPHPSTSLEPTKVDIKPTGENSCKEEGYFGNKADCKKFYRCVDNGKPKFEIYEYSCGEGTIWDEDIVACNHPQDVKRRSCSMESTISATTASTDLSSSSLSTTIKETSIHTISTEQVVSEQPSSITTTTLRAQIGNMGQKDNKCNEEGFFGDTQDCKNFYRCVNDGKDKYIKYEFTCGEGTIWDKDITACNHPRDVESPSCSLEGSMNSTTIGDDVSSTSEITTNKVTSTSTPLVTTSKPTTKGDSTWSTESNVKETSTTERTTVQTLTTGTSPATTTKSKSTTENMQPPAQNICSEEGFFGNVNDCKSFYRCVDNGKNGFIKYDFTCGEGTVWDQNILACNHPQDTERPSCSLSSSVDSTTTDKDVTKGTTATSTSTATATPTSTSTSTATSTPTSTSTATPTPTSTSTSTSSSTSTTTEENSGSSEQNEIQQPGESQGNFSCTRPGFYPNPNDCKKFYRCVDWNNDGTRFSIFHFVCGEGTIWDPSLDTCNYEDAVYPPRNCSGSSSQTQNSTEMTTSENSTTGNTEETSTSQQTTVMTTSKQPTSTENAMTTQQSTTVQTTTTTTDQQTTSTEKATTQAGTSSDLSTTSDTTTTERSTTPMDQTTQTERTTEGSSTTEGTTQQSTTEEATSTTDISTKTTEGDKITTEATQQTTDSTTTSSTPKDKCPDMDDNQYAYVCPTSFRRHPKYCNIFYQCTEDDDSHDLKIALFNCPNNTIYDETKTQCVDQNKSTKSCDGTLARSNTMKRYSNDYIEPLIVDTDSYACPGVGYFPFERNQECSPALLKCQRSTNNKIKGYVFKCPEGYVFWTISKRCERIARVRDCKRSIYPWSKKHEIPNEIKNVAS